MSAEEVKSLKSLVGRGVGSCVHAGNSWVAKRWIVTSVLVTSAVIEGGDGGW